MDQRALFFAGAAALAGVLTPVAPEGLRYVPPIVAAVYVVLAILSYLDWRTYNR